MRSGFSLHHFPFHLEPKASLRLPAYNKVNVIRWVWRHVSPVCRVGTGRADRVSCELPGQANIPGVQWFNRRGAPIQKFNIRP